MSPKLALNDSIKVINTISCKCSWRENGKAHNCECLFMDKNKKPIGRVNVEGIDLDSLEPII